MKKRLFSVCISLLLLIGIAGSVSAEKMYSATVPMFAGGLDLETGKTSHHPAILIVTFGDDYRLEHLLRPAIANFVDFDQYPEVDLHFEYDSDAENPFLLVPEHTLEVAFLEIPSLDDVDFTLVGNLDFQTVDAGELFTIVPGELLVALKTEFHALYVLDITSSGGLEIDIDVRSSIPEPVSFVFMSLGLLLIIGIVRKRTRLPRILRVLIFALLLSGPASAAAQTVSIFEETFASDPFTDGRWVVYQEDDHTPKPDTIKHKTDSDACGQSHGYVRRMYRGDQGVEYTGSFSTQGYTNLTLSFWSWNEDDSSIEAKVEQDGSWVSVADVGSTGSWTQHDVSVSGTITGIRFLLKSDRNKKRRLDCISIVGDRVHTITASAGLGGSISPAGDVQVIAGEAQTFTIESEPGFELENLLLDGADVAPLSPAGTDTAVTYTVETVMADHTLEARFTRTPEWVSFSGGGTPGPAELEVLHSDIYGMQVSVTTPGLNVTGIVRDGAAWQQIGVPGMGHISTVGTPQLPMLSRFIAIPKGAVVSVDYGEPFYRELDDEYLVSPVQAPREDQSGEPDPAFEIDEGLYGSDAFYPADIATLEDTGTIRDCAVTILRVFPVQFNPVQKRLRVYPDITVDITFTGGSAEFIGAAYLDPSFAKLFKRMLLNADVVRASWGNNLIDPLLIIVPDIFTVNTEFNTALEAFKNWKIKRGIETEVRTTDETGSSASDIRNYLQTAYNTWATKPSHILLIGDADYIPTNYEDWNGDIITHPHDYGSSAEIGTDVYYTTMDGAGDYYPDLHVGRLSVDNTVQAVNRLNAIMEYEQNPPAETAFYRHAAMIAYFEDLGVFDYWEDSDSSVPSSVPVFTGEADGEADSTFAYTSEILAHLFSSDEQYTLRYDGIHRLYYAENLTEASLPSYWCDNAVCEADYAGAGYPAAWECLYNIDGEWWCDPKGTIPEDYHATSMWNAGHEEISASINSGRFLLTYRGHGFRTRWEQPYYTATHVALLGNANKRPVVWSLACDTGWFDEETDGLTSPTQGEISVSEAWERHSDGGAVAIIAGTRISWSEYNDKLFWGLTDAVWPRFPGITANEGWTGAEPPLLEMGAALTYAKLYVTRNLGLNDWQKAMLEMYHLFGDPTMQIWTQEPDSLNVTHSSNFEPGASVELTVDQAGAVISMSQNGIILGQALSNGGTATTIALPSPLEAGEVEIVVTKDGCRPYVSTVPVMKSTLIELLSFDVQYQGNTRIIQWETGSEMNTLGFFIYAGQRDGTFAQVNETIIMAQGFFLGGIGWSYEFVDEGYNAESTNFLYKLVELETGGTENEYGPFFRPPSDMTFAMTYGGKNDTSEWINHIQQTSDGNYILAGNTYASSDLQKVDTLLLKLDTTGNVIWQKDYSVADQGVSFSFQQTAFQQTFDGSYIMAGHNRLDDSESWLLKVDHEGNVNWHKIYKAINSYAFFFSSIQQTIDGGYIVAGYIYPSPTEVDVWGLKLDSVGNIIWQKSYGGLGHGVSIQQTTDGGYILSGETETFSVGADDVWVLKLDENGDVIWQKTYGGSNFDRGGRIQQTSDGGYIVTGWTKSFGAGAEDAWILRLNSNGGILWQKTYGGSDGDYAYYIYQTTDGGYIVTGTLGSIPWFFKLNGDGDVIWQKIYDGINSDHGWLSKIQQLSDGGYIMVGGYLGGYYSGDYIGGSLILRIDEEGDIDGCPLGEPSDAQVTDTTAVVKDSHTIPVDTHVVMTESSILPIETSIFPKYICTPIAFNITPGGGIATSPDGLASVTFPAGATSQNLFIYIEKLENGSTPLPNGGFTLLGNAYEYTAFNAQGDIVTGFDSEVEVTIHYDPNVLGGIDPYTLKLSYYDEMSEQWVELPSTVDLVNHTVTALTSHFTKFALFSPLPFSVRKHGNGSGTVHLGDRVCPADCLVVSVPTPENGIVILKAIPDEGSRFARWTDSAGQVLTERFHAEPGDTIIAVFEQEQ